MDIKPDPEMKNLWVWQLPVVDINCTAGAFEVADNFTYHIMRKYLFNYDGNTVYGTQTLKQVNDKCNEQYKNNKYTALNNNKPYIHISVNNDESFLFKKKLQTTESLNTYDLLAWIADVYSKLPPLTANILTLIAVRRLNTNARFYGFSQIYKDTHLFIQGILDGLDEENFYNFRVQVKNKNNYTVEERKWNIKQLFEHIADQNETILPILCLDVPFFELIIAKILFLEVVVPIVFCRDYKHTIYYDNNKQLYEADKSTYRTTVTDPDMSNIHQLMKPIKTYCFYPITKDDIYDDGYTKLNEKTIAYFILFRDSGTYRMAYLN
jgi:hypothetical protein